MTLMEERIRSQIRQRIMRSRIGSLKPARAQLKIKLDTRSDGLESSTRILIEEIGWEAYEWQRT